MRLRFWMTVYAVLCAVFANGCVEDKSCAAQSWGDQGLAPASVEVSPLASDEVGGTEVNADQDALALDSGASACTTDVWILEVDEAGTGPVPDAVWALPFDVRTRAVGAPLAMESDGAGHWSLTLSQDDVGVPCEIAAEVAWLYVPVVDGALGRMVGGPMGEARFVRLDAWDDIGAVQIYTSALVDSVTAVVVDIPGQRAVGPLNFSLSGDTETGDLRWGLGDDTLLCRSAEDFVFFGAMLQDAAGTTIGAIAF